MNQPRRRRTRAGLPVAVIIAILTAIFSSRSRAPQRAPSPRTPAAVPSAPANAPARGTDVRDAPANAPSSARGGSGPGFTNRQHLVEHFEKHGDEFPGLDMSGYLRAAQALRDAPAGGTVLEVRRGDGVVTRFDRQSGAFLAFNRDRTIRTFFRPNDGEAYFRRQASRTPGGGP